MEIKKLIWVLLPLVLSSFLSGCYNVVQESRVKEQFRGSSYIGKKQFKRKVIIMESVGDPLPSEAKNIKSMPNKSEPQQIPNVNLNNPLIITKMPHSNN